jgi:hypothetical protein
MRQRIGAGGIERIAPAFLLFRPGGTDETRSGRARRGAETQAADTGPIAERAIAHRHPLKEHPMYLARLMAVLILVTCTSAFAQKGGSPAPDVITIDQAKATNGNVTAGDAAGFPITINASGSYKLTSNLVVPAGTDAILVTAGNVSIDLNGFSIIGPGNCSGQPASMTCTATGTRGISSAVSNIHRLSVRNGMVGGFGMCLEARYVARVSDLSLHDCSMALTAMEGSIVDQVSIHRTADAGALYGSTVDGVQLFYARTGFSTFGSILRSLSMFNVYQAFAPAGNTNSALSQSVINATLLGSGVQSVGGNLCNGVAC